MISPPQSITAELFRSISACFIGMLFYFCRTTAPGIRARLMCHFDVAETIVSFQSAPTLRLYCSYVYDNIADAGT